MVLPMHYQCKIEQYLCHKHFQGNWRCAVGIQSESKSWDSGEMTFRNRINYITLGGMLQNTWQTRLLFVFQACKLTENCRHLMEEPEKHSREQEFCCYIFLTFFFLIVIPNTTLEEQRPSAFLSLVLCSPIQKMNLFCDIAWQEISVSEMLDFWEEYPLSTEVFKHHKSCI